MPFTARPDLDESAEYYFTYINKVPSGDIRVTLRQQCDRVMGMLNDIPGSFAGHRYAPDKWSIRQVLNHIIDTERVFTFRAFWFARGLEAPQPGFDQDDAVAGADADTRDWQGLIREFQAVRTASLELFDSFSAEAWVRRGVASGHPVSVRALAWISVGHVEHHMGLLQERYLQGRNG